MSHSIHRPLLKTLFGAAAIGALSSAALAQQPQPPAIPEPHVQTITLYEQTTAAWGTEPTVVYPLVPNTPGALPEEYATFAIGTHRFWNHNVFASYDEGVVSDKVGTSTAKCERTFVEATPDLPDPSAVGVCEYYPGDPNTCGQNVQHPNVRYNIIRKQKCTVDIDLDGGKLVLEGVTHETDFELGVPQDLAITGGTGNYRNARGEAVLTLLPGTSFADIITQLEIKLKQFP